MRVTVLRTFSSNCVDTYEPLRTMGHEISTIVYDLVNVHDATDKENLKKSLDGTAYFIMHPDQFEQLPELVNVTNPDLVLMIGCCDSGGLALVPSASTLAKIGQRHPFVHLCFDGSETVWWRQLCDYYDHNSFALQINIDGVKVGPIGERGWTVLTPIDLAGFPNPPRVWGDRSYRLGFCGGWGGAQLRTTALNELLAAGLVHIRPRDDGSSHGYREFLSQCQCVWNHAVTGTGDKMHVKGRVLETALAGAVLFENEDSPTANWFTSGVDYISYRNTLDVARGLKWVDANPIAAQTMAQSLREKVIAQHSPRVLWGRVIEHLGLQ